mmetsp:Transcript_6657/g.15159  ORF Transcript_6657/g.15159 Transcript_6657/m.15159 type:complete len:209 (-) Transcript_6657:343-969(-)
MDSCAKNALASQSKNSCSETGAIPLSLSLILYRCQSLLKCARYCAESPKDPPHVLQHLPPMEEVAPSPCDEDDWDCCRAMLGCCCLVSCCCFCCSCCCCRCCSSFSRRLAFLDFFLCAFFWFFRSELGPNSSSSSSSFLSFVSWFSAGTGSSCESAGPLVAVICSCFCSSSCCPSCCCCCCCWGPWLVATRFLVIVVVAIRTSVSKSS